jgi:ketosteroid isomerase-like protein
MRFTTSAIATLSLVVASCTRATPSTLSPSATRTLGDSLIALDSTMNHAVDNLDCARGLSYIGDERPLFISGGHVVETREQLLKVCQNLVAPRTGAVFVARSVTAHVLSPSAGYVVRDGEYTVHLRNGQTNTEHLSMTTIWSRQGGAWKMVHLHESAIRP